MRFAERFRSIRGQAGELAVAWLGQAGFLFKNSEGKILMMDAYLSDLSEVRDGNKRLTPSVLDAEELIPDVILASHEHSDHLDLFSLPLLMKGGARLYCSEGCIPLCEQEGTLPMGQIRVLHTGDVIEECGYRVEAVFADHGDTSPSALGFLISADGCTVYFAGDGAYQYSRMRYATEKEIDLLLVPINGEYGNMNERDAAMLARQTEAGLTVPCHFWTFARHLGNPYLFETEMHHTAPECREYTMAQGEIITLTKTHEQNSKEKRRI